VREAAGTPLRVALFHALPPGGAIRALYETVKRFPPEIEVDLFAADVAPVDRRFAALTAGTSHLDLSSVVASTKTYSLPAAVRLVAPHIGRFAAFVVGGEAMRRVQKAMARDINAGGYDVAFLHACRFSLSVPIAEWLQVPSVYYAQEARRVGYETQPSPLGAGAKGLTSLIPMLRRPYEFVGRRRDRRAVGAVDRLLCNSRFSADMLSAAYGVDPVVCYLGVDAEAFPVLEHANGSVEGSGNGCLRVLSVGALHPVKGHDLALRATARAAEVLAERLGELHIVYERQRAGYAEELADLASHLGVELHLHRGITDERLAELYGSASVTVCAARLEPFGLTSLESMSCGTPVVAVAQGGFRETVVDGVNGYLAERETASLAKGIVRVARGELSATPASLHAFVSDNWSWESAAERIADELRRQAAETTMRS
jgi:glycosyltransferase involved in cell wall biosynthesis